MEISLLREKAICLVTFFINGISSFFLFVVVVVVVMLIIVYIFPCYAM